MKKTQSAILGTGCLILAVLMLLFVVWRGFDVYAMDASDRAIFIILVFCGFALSSFVHTLLHELGHVLFGKCAGMKFYALAIGGLIFCRRPNGRGIRIRIKRFGEHAGSTTMVPKGTERLEGRYIAMTLGGLMFSAVYCLFLTLVVIFAGAFGLIAYALIGGGFPFVLYAFLTNAIPFESSRGKTDGAVLRGLSRKDDASIVLIRILAVQALYFSGKRPSEVDRALYFDLPQLPEDDINFIILLNLRYLYYLDGGDAENAKLTLDRLESLLEGMPSDYRTNVECDLLYDAATAGEEDRARELYFRTREFLTADENPTNLRIRAAYVLYVEKNPNEARALALRGLGEADPFMIAGIGAFEKILLERLRAEIDGLLAEKKRLEKGEWKQKMFVFKPRPEPGKTED